MKTISELMNSKIENLELSVRSSNCMKRADIKTLGDLTKLDIEQLKKMKNFGTKSLEELKQKLSALELNFGMDDRIWADWGLSHIDLVKTICWETI